MHGLVIVDDNGIPLRKAILWNDTRNSIQCRQIEDIYGERLNYNRYGRIYTSQNVMGTTT